MRNEPQEHDNSGLLPYLREIAAAEKDGGFPVADTGDLWGDDAKKVRQQLYIAKLAKKQAGIAGDVLVLTDKGKEVLANG